MKVEGVGLGGSLPSFPIDKHGTNAINPYNSQRIVKEQAKELYETHKPDYREFFRKVKGIGQKNSRIHQQLISCALARLEFERNGGYLESFKPPHPNKWNSLSEKDQK